MIHNSVCWEFATRALMSPSLTTLMFFWASVTMGHNFINHNWSVSRQLGKGIWKKK